MATENIIVANFAVLTLALFALWGVSVRIGNSSIIDIFWGIGFVLVAWVSLGLSDNWQLKPMLLASMVTVWGVRLASYLAWRNVGKPEDYRYAAMRKRHGQRFPLVSLLTVFGLQGILTLTISLPIQVGIGRGTNWTTLCYVGLAIWLTGLVFETLGDYQLATFKADPANRGRVMNRGLWRYTRHPNYFGDFLVWWGLFLVAAEPTSWWWTIVGPLLMSFLLIRVSGVRLLESSLRTRITGYEEYLQRTSAFVPLPPKSKV